MSRGLELWRTCEMDMILTVHPIPNNWIVDGCYGIENLLHFSIFIPHFANVMDT